MPLPAHAWQPYSKRTLTHTPCHSTRVKIWPNPHGETEPLWRCRTHVLGPNPPGWGEVGKDSVEDLLCRIFRAWLTWQFTAIATLSSQKVNSKALWVGIRAANRVIKLNAFDWLTLMIRGLGRLDEAICLFTQRIFRIFFYSKNSHFVPFTENASLCSRHRILALSILYTLPKPNHKWLTSKTRPTFKYLYYILTWSSECMWPPPQLLE